MTLLHAIFSCLFFIYTQRCCASTNVEPLYDYSSFEPLFSLEELEKDITINPCLNAPDKSLAKKQKKEPGTKPKSMKRKSNPNRILHYLTDIDRTYNQGKALFFQTWLYMNASSKTDIIVENITQNYQQYIQDYQSVLSDTPNTQDICQIFRYDLYTLIDRRIRCERKSTKNLVYKS
jgi:hypothetical protein